MSISRILKYLFILTISAGLPSTHQAWGQQATDTVATDTVKPRVRLPERSGRHLSLAIDLAHPIINQYTSGHTAWDFSVDYYLSHDLYLVADGGFGGSDINFTNLAYKTTNSFLKAGVNRSLLLRNDSADWNNLFIGFRLGAASVNRTAANYIITDSLWGNSAGTQPGKDFVAVWAEIGMGVRVQLVRNLFAGWYMSGRFMVNGKSFSDLAPAYIAGFGKADKNSAFDFDVYLSYAFNWKRRSQRVVTSSPDATTK
jgi:Domain of unknown function (DUF6048)